MVDIGRSAWTTLGKDNGSIYYERIHGKPIDGSTPEKGVYYEYVHYGVKAIQERLLSLGYENALDNPFEQDRLGEFTRQTKRMVLAFQKDKLEQNYHSGKAGQITCTELFGSYLAESGVEHPEYLFGFAYAESGFDPGAQGATTPADSGLFQINTLVHTDIDVATACDYTFATEWTGKRFKAAWNKYQGKGLELRTNCAIAQHNAPAWADEWFAAGVAPNEKISKYVTTIRKFSELYDW